MLIDFIVDYRLHSITVYVFRERSFRIIGYAALGHFGISIIVTFTARFRPKLTTNGKSTETFAHAPSGIGRRRRAGNGYAIDHLTLMLLMATLANTKLCKNPEKKY